MFRVALTLCFTLTTLLGPGVCCCSFAAFAHTNPVSTSGDHLTTKPIKSCCEQQTPPCGDHDKQKPGKPSKCPCEHGKQVTSLPPDAASTADFVAQIRLLDTLFVFLFVQVEYALSTLASSITLKFEPVSRLAGRDLLTAFCLLRC
ncbi:hypothetical protein BH11PLA2_BH11PLA2_20980 [soil metagenome]